jgi:hypothetical protein
MLYSVELTAGPLPEGTDVADVAGRLSDELAVQELLEVAIGGRLDLRTIGVTVDIDAADIDDALHAVVTTVAGACRAAGILALPVLHAEVRSAAATAVG